MFLVFLDSQLKHVWEDSSHKSKRWSPGLVKAIRKKIQLLANAYDERDLKNVRSLHFKKLKETELELIQFVLMNNIDLSLRLKQI